MRPVRVGVVGHWQANIGHDLMALGVERALGLAFTDGFMVRRIEHHRPLDIYPSWFVPRHLPAFRHGRGGSLAASLKAYLNRPDVSRRAWRMSSVGDLDLAIICGGPLITPWLTQGDLGLPYQHMLGAFHSKGVPVLNLSVGTAYPRERMRDATLSEGEAAFLRRMFSYTTDTTVRDLLAQRLCREVGQELPLVPDTGFVAGASLDTIRPRETTARYIVLNAQRYGANEDWGQGVDPERWLGTLAELARRLSSRTGVLFVCHSELELRTAQRIAPQTRRVRPRTVDDYADIVSGAVAGVCTRVHSGIALASVGVPVVGVGTDSRLGTLETLGLPCHYVKDVDADTLEDALDGLLRCADAERQRLLDVRSAAEAEYTALLRRTLRPH